MVDGITSDCADRVWYVLYVSAWELDEIAVVSNMLSGD